MCKVWRLYINRKILLQTPENLNFRKSLKKHIVYAGKLLWRKTFFRFDTLPRHFASTLCLGTSALRAEVPRWFCSPPGPSGLEARKTAAVRLPAHWYICVSISYYEFKVFSKVHISETVNDRNLSFVLPALILLKSICTNFQGRILILKWFFKHVKLTIFANSTILSITAAGKFYRTWRLHVSWQF